MTGVYLTTGARDQDLDSASPSPSAGRGPLGSPPPRLASVGSTGPLARGCGVWAAAVAGPRFSKPKPADDSAPTGVTVRPRAISALRFDPRPDGPRTGGRPRHGRTAPHGCACAQAQRVGCDPPRVRSWGRSPARRSQSGVATQLWMIANTRTKKDAAAKEGRTASGPNPGTSQAISHACRKKRLC